MRLLILISAVLVVSGCAAKLVDSNERMVMVNAGPPDAAGAMKIAQEQCAKYGRHARLNSKPLGDRNWAFDCVN